MTCAHGPGKGNRDVVLWDEVLENSQAAGKALNSL